MLNSEGFDLWANEYDNTVDRNSNKYPFDGYYEGLTYIYNKIESNKSVLDIGFGTATLTKKLYDKNCKIYGIDFSKRMIEIASKKMPDAMLVQFDFNNGLPKELLNKKFNYIISSYAFHHLSDKKKVEFINLLYKRLNLKGKIIILDIAFKTRRDLNKCYEDNKDDWDENEVYFVWDELKDKIKFNCKYTQISSCAGIIEIEN